MHLRFLNISLGAGWLFFTDAWGIDFCWGYVKDAKPGQLRYRRHAGIAIRSEFFQDGSFRCWWRPSPSLWGSEPGTIRSIMWTGRRKEFVGIRRALAETFMVWNSGKA